MEEQTAVQAVSDTDWRSQLEFNFRKIRAKDIKALNQAFGAVDMDKVAEIFAQIITRCPSAWGAPSDPETYLNLPFYEEIQDILKVMAEAGKNVRRA